MDEFMIRDCPSVHICILQKCLFILFVKHNINFQFANKKCILPAGWILLSKMIWQLVAEIVV